MKKRKTVLMLLLAAATFSASLSGCGADTGSGETAESSPDASDGSVELEPFTPPVTFEAVSADGETVTSDIFADSRLTMVNVWATYCNPCLMEMPYLGELAAEYSPEDFQIIGIISDVMEDMVRTELELLQKPVAYMQKEDKLALVQRMENKGIFDVKGAVEYVAERLGVTNYTIYNYLKAIRSAKR